MDFDRRTFLAAGAAAMTVPALATAPEARGLRLQPDREEVVPVEGGRIYVRINGDLRGPRAPIVFSHGGPGSAHWYFLNATALADERAVILYDQLDSGRSDHPGDPKNWTIPRFLSELPAIAHHLGIGRWHMLGASWGGTLALEYAAQRPAELASAIIQSPLVSTPIWMRDANALKDAMPPEIRRLLYLCDTPGAAPQAECDAATDAFYARHVRRFAPPPEIEAYRAALPRSFSPDVYHHMWGRAEFVATGTLKDYDGTALLKRLDPKRTLFVAGEYDEAVPTTVASFAKQAGARFETVPGAAHTIMNDNPEAYLTLLRAWLRSHD
ncbi:proline iminopeptidase-family hydrolase [Sphingomonas tabacisoli]|uniref:Proline iminopeptidase-family hydrolase n=1 Tax=Sphingomonas tabacisoli TaxID=2249466 RepID=A0ABW4I3X7_9SPHN